MFGKIKKPLAQLEKEKAEDPVKVEEERLLNVFESSASEFVT